MVALTFMCGLHICNIATHVSSDPYGPCSELAWWLHGFICMPGVDKDDCVQLETLSTSAVASASVATTLGRSQDVSVQAVLRHHCVVQFLSFSPAMQQFTDTYKVEFNRLLLTST